MTKEKKPHVWLTPETHQRIKVLSAKRGDRTLGDTVEAAVDALELWYDHGPNDPPKREHTVQQD